MNDLILIKHEQNVCIWICGQYLQDWVEVSIVLRKQQISLLKPAKLPMNNTESPDTVRGCSKKLKAEMSAKFSLSADKHLLRCSSHFRATAKVLTQISRLRGFTRSYGKTSVGFMNTGPAATNGKRDLTSFHSTSHDDVMTWKPFCSLVDSPYKGPAMRGSVSLHQLLIHHEIN